jgi:integrase
LKQSSLPPRWRFRYGAYYYRVPPGQEARWGGKKEVRLGATEAEAWRTWFEHLGDDGNGDMVTMNHVFDEWWREYVLIHLKPTTREIYQYYLLPLRKVFGEMRPGSILPVHAYKYRAKRPRVAGNREVSVLSSALAYATEKGVITHNPLRGQVTRRGVASEPARQRVPSIEEVAAFCLVNPHLRGYAALKRITGLRQGQLLALDLTQHWDGEVLTPPTSKGGKLTRYTGESIALTIAAILGNRIPRGPLFCTRKGGHMTATGFRSMWARAMRKFVASGGERFNEHDIRKLTATSADSLEHAQMLLGHQEQKTTARVYRIGAQSVEALK